MVVVVVVVVVAAAAAITHSATVRAVVVSHVLRQLLCLGGRECCHLTHWLRCGCAWHERTAVPATSRQFRKAPALSSSGATPASLLCLRFGLLKAQFIE